MNMASATVLPIMGSHDNPILGNATEHYTTEQQNAVHYWVPLIRNNLDNATKREDEHSNALIDEEIMNAPRRRSNHDSVTNAIANELYPHLVGSLASIIQYEKDIVMLRHLVVDQRRTAIAKATARNDSRNWVKRVSKQGPWDEKANPLSLAGASSLPMPVEQSSKESLAPFFAHLAANGTHEPTPDTVGKVDLEPYYHTEMLEFEKGVIYEDGRVDLCKMVTGPRNIGDLMEALKPNSFSKHFLLGNNIIGPTGAKAIATFINEFPERFETWYLAGNCIDTASFTLLVNAMIGSPVVTNVWLKRNPLRPGAANDIFRLITQSPALRTLDLDQTELGNAGVAEVLRLLTSHSPATPLPLRNLYLNATGIGPEACQQIALYLASPNCTLESLYIADNPIGSAGVYLAEGLAANTSLQRLSLQSCGLKNEAVIAIATALHGNSKIRMFDIGQAYATEDLGMRFNWVNDAAVPSLTKLVETTKLEYFNISYTPIAQRRLNTLLSVITASPSLLYFFAKPLVTGGDYYAAVKAGQENARLRPLVRERLEKNVKAKYGVEYAVFEVEYKRFLASHEDVRLIDSVYRNRDAGMAKRGLKVLDKWWKVNDETLERVMDGTLE